jgi:hypothetical protein
MCSLPGRALEALTQHHVDGIPSPSALRDGWLPSREHKAVAIGS